MPTTALVLDDDLGFCMWLGRALNEAGILALPACRSEEALDFACNPSYRIDVIIFNPEVEGCREVLAQNRGAKVIAIGAAGKLPVDGTVERPSGRALPQPDGYVQVVNAVLRVKNN
jgi:hypothetical protein